jgi:hypothetical protein
VSFLLVAVLGQVVTIPNCSQTGPNNSCLACIPNYTLQNGNCVSTTAANSQLTSSLSLIASNPALLTQLEAYIQLLIANSGTPLQTNPCSSITNGVCVACSQGYSMVNGVCQGSSPSSTASTTTTVTSTATPAATTSTGSSLPGLTTSSTTGAATTATTTSTTTTTAPSSTTTTSAQNIVFLPFFLQPSLPGLVTLTTTTNSNYTDYNCKTVNYALNICSECYAGFYFSPINQSCVATNPLCQNVSSTNLCLSCYTGYLLLNGNCTIDPNYKSTTLSGILVQLSPNSNSTD